MKYLFTLALSLPIVACSHYTHETDKIAESQNAITSKSAKGKVTRAGLFKVIRSGGLVDSPNTSTGKSFYKPIIQQLEETNKIPIKKDAHMSLQYRIWNIPINKHYVKLRRVLIHPPMTLPDGSVTTGSDYKITGKVSAGQVIAYTGYGLNEEYEMIEGDWTFQIWYQDKKVIEKTFTTYWQEQNIPASADSEVNLYEFRL